MNFCGFHSNVCMLTNRVLCCQISLKSMTAFMCHNIYITACSVEIGKNKRRFIIRNIGHIAAYCLCFSSEHIKKLIVHHKIKKFLGFRRKFLIHLLPCLKDFLRCSFRLWISFWTVYHLICIRKFRQSQTLFSFFKNTFCKRNPYFFYLTS